MNQKKLRLAFVMLLLSCNNSKIEKNNYINKNIDSTNDSVVTKLLSKYPDKENNQELKISEYQYKETILKIRENVSNPDYDILFEEYTLLFTEFKKIKEEYLKLFSEDTLWTEIELNKERFYKKNYSNVIDEINKYGSPYHKSFYFFDEINDTVAIEKIINFYSKNKKMDPLILVELRNSYGVN